MLIERPVATWASGPLEVIAAFEKPVEAGQAKALVGQNVRYYDLTEPARGAGGQDLPAGELRIVGVNVADGGRTLVLATDPHPRSASHISPFGTRAANPGTRASCRFFGSLL